MPKQRHFPNQKQFLAIFKMRQLKYSQAISEAHVQSMQADPSVFIMGVGVGDPTGIFGTTKEAHQQFGSERVFDTPMSENTLTGIGVGAAMTGLRPVLVHARNDFTLLTMDQIINHAAKWKYMSGGQYDVPFLIRSIVGRGWGQAAQHAQSLHALFAHIPGLNVILPTTPYDAKGLILSSMQSKRTTICIEHRWLYDKEGDVPEEPYTIDFGVGRKVLEGGDATVVALSHMVLECQSAAELLKAKNIAIDLIDPRTIRPLDINLIVESVRKTRHLVVVDNGWKDYGFSAEVTAAVCERAWGDLARAPLRITWPDVPVPCSPVLEGAFYPSPAQIAQQIETLLGKSKGGTSAQESDRKKEFTGPF